jgi:HK97 family phage portal protein
VATLFAGPVGVPAGWWRDNPAEQIAQFQSWVYAAVNAIAQEAARQEPRLYRHTGPAEHEQQPIPRSHPLARLLAHPNPWLTPWELWYLTTVHLELTGNCFWYVATSEQDGGTPVELWVIPSPWVRVIPDREQFLRGYTVSAPGLPTEAFTPDEIIHLKYPNPGDPHYGLSPLRASALTADAHLELLRSRYHLFRAGPRPGVVLQTDQTLTDATVRRLEERLEAKFAGRENWHRPMVLEQGLRASPWTLTPAEMDFLSSARMTRDELLAAFRVPAAVLGLSENLGLGSAIWDGARAMFCEGTVQPKLDLIAQVLTRDLARRWGPDLAVLFPDCSPRARQQARAEEEMDARLGLRSIQEIRRSRGLE